MTSYIRRADPVRIERIFWLIFLVTLLAAVVPPFYMRASGAGGLVLGVPLALAYWIIDPFILMVAMGVYYWIEHVRGDLDGDAEDGPPGDGAVGDALAGGGGS